MADIRIRAVRDPLATPYLTRAALLTIGRAAAMGLLPEPQVIETLDLDTLKAVARRLNEVGVAPAPVAELATWSHGDPKRLGLLLEQVDRALLDSPVPQREWGELVRVLGEPLLAALAGVSRTSLRRYAAGRRATPDGVAGRLHHVALVVGNLAGSYNDYGIRRWFERTRAQLDGRSPRAILKGAWSPDAAGPAKVLALAESLLGAPAT
jgi:hypothetical protein